MSTLPTRRFTAEKYLARERAEETKSEFYAGEIIAMGGASERHVLIVSNLIAELRQQLKAGPCKAYSTDMRVKVSSTGLYTYPDVAVACSESRFEDDNNDTLLNPNVIIEVLSRSTEACDRGKKFEHYRTIESLQEYILVSQDQALLEQFVRQQSGQWLLSITNTLEQTLELTSIGCSVPLMEIYDKVEMPPPGGVENGQAR